MATEKSVSFDPKKIMVKINGQRVTGFTHGVRTKVIRGLNGKVELTVILHGTSPWVLTLKRMLGLQAVVDVDYDDIFAPYAENLRVRAELRIVGYEVEYSSEIPVFHFKFVDMSEETKRK